jgi:nitrogen fixation/metabolism regulation signal transduction histidine kinase
LLFYHENTAEFSYIDECGAQMTAYDILEDAPVGIIVTNRDLQILRLNPKASYLLKTDPDTHTQYRLSDFLKADQLERFSSMFSDPEATPTKSGFIHEGSNRRLVRFTVSIPEGSSELIWYLEDQHEKWVLQNQIDSFRRLPREYGHDMNNLLTVIISAAQMIELDLTNDDEILEDIRDIITASNRAAAQTHQFMNLGRRLVIDPETISLQNLINENSVLLKSLLGHSELEIQNIVGVAPIFATKISVLSSLIYLILHARINSREAKFKLDIQMLELDTDFATGTLGVYFQKGIALTLMQDGYPNNPDKLHVNHNQILPEADFLTLCWEGVRRANGAIFSRFANNALCISLYFPDMSDAL